MKPLLLRRRFLSHFASIKPRVHWVPDAGAVSVICFTSWRGRLAGELSSMQQAFLDDHENSSVRSGFIPRRPLLIRKPNFIASTKLTKLTDMPVTFLTQSWVPHGLAALLQYFNWLRLFIALPSLSSSSMIAGAFLYPLITGDNSGSLVPTSIPVMSKILCPYVRVLANESHRVAVHY